jgi:hypothetical protein
MRLSKGQVPGMNWLVYSSSSGTCRFMSMYLSSSSDVCRQSSGGLPPQRPARAVRGVQVGAHPLELLQQQIPLGVRALLHHRIERRLRVFRRLVHPAQRGGHEAPHDLRPVADGVQAGEQAVAQHVHAAVGVEDHRAGLALGAEDRQLGEAPIGHEVRPTLEDRGGLGAGLHRHLLDPRLVDAGGRREGGEQQLARAGRGVGHRAAFEILRRVDPRLL